MRNLPSLAGTAERPAQGREVHMASGAPFHAQRKSLRERWLMDGAEGPEGPEEATLQDLETPEGQAQDRIRNLEDSLFT